MWIEKRYRSEYQDCSKKGLRLRFEKTIDPDYAIVALHFANGSDRAIIFRYDMKNFN